MFTNLASAAVTETFRRLGADASYYGSSGVVTVRLIARRPDEIIDVYSVRGVVPTVVLDILGQADFDPKDGDLVALGEEEFRLQGAPTRDDPHRLIWRCPAVPA